MGGPCSRSRGRVAGAADCRAGCLVLTAGAAATPAGPVAGWPGPPMQKRPSAAALPLHGRAGPACSVRTYRPRAAPGFGPPRRPGASKRRGFDCTRKQLCEHFVWRQFRPRQRPAVCAHASAAGWFRARRLCRRQGLDAAKPPGMRALPPTPAPRRPPCCPARGLLGAPRAGRAALRGRPARPRSAASCEDSRAVQGTASVALCRHHGPRAPGKDRRPVARPRRRPRRRRWSPGAAMPVHGGAGGAGLLPGRVRVPRAGLRGPPRPVHDPQGRRRRCRRPAGPCRARRCSSWSRSRGT